MQNYDIPAVVSATYYDLAGRRYRRTGEYRPPRYGEYYLGREGRNMGRATYCSTDNFPYERHILIKDE